MKKIIKKIFCNKYIYLIMCLLFAFALYYIDYRNKLKSFNVDANYYLNTFIGLSITIIISSLIIIFTSKKIFKKEKNIWWGYIFLSLIFGSLYIAVIPMFAQSDEPSHFYRAYEIVNNHFVPTYNGNLITNEFPSSIEKTFDIKSGSSYANKKYSDVSKMTEISLNKDDKKTEIRYATYVPFCYLPQFLGMKLGDMMNLSPYYIGMLGRISSLIFCTIIIGIGLKILPSKKTFAMLLFLTPVSLSYISAISADGAIMSFSFLFVSIVLWFIKNHIKFNWKYYLLFLILMVIVSVSKSVYFPIILLILFLPNDIFKSKKQKYLIIGSLLIISSVSVYTWAHMALSVDTSEVAYNNSAHWILANPIVYFIILLRTLFSNFYDFLTNIVASNFMAHNQASIYSFIPIMLLISLFLSFFSEDCFAKKIGVIQIGYVLLSFAIIYALIATGMYVYNTACATYDGYPIIIGIQGRYFIPMLPLLLLLPHKKHFDFKTENFVDLFNMMNVMVLLSLIITFII